jgi:hypothetical protein
MKIITLVITLLATTNIFANDLKSYESQMKFVMSVVENESEGINVRSVSRCEIESDSKKTIGAMKITNLVSYYLSGIKNLRVKETLNVGFGSSNSSQQTLARSFPYSIEFDGGHTNVVMKSYVSMENLQFPQYNRPPEIKDWTRYYFMFKTKQDAEKAMPVLKNLVKLCS